MFFTDAHAEVERPDERVIARADVLKINKQNIDIFQHFCCRFAMFAVKAVNRNAEARMLIVFPFDHIVLRLAEKPMLRTKKRCDLEKIAVVSLENMRRMRTVARRVRRDASRKSVRAQSVYRHRQSARLR